MALDDYGALLQSGRAAVPDYAAQEAQKQLLALRKKELNAQIESAQRQIDEKQGFQTDLDAVMTNPTAEGISRLILKHPEQAAAVKSGWDVLDKGRQQTDLTQMAEIYSASTNGRPELAAQLLKRRIEADKAGDGKADPTDEAILAALESGDPVQQKAATAMIGYHAAAANPEQWNKMLDSAGPSLMPVGAGTVVIDKNNPSGPPVFESPYKPETITDPGTGQIFRLVPKTGAGGSGIVADQPAPRTIEEAWQRILQQETGGRHFNASGGPIRSSKGAIGIAQVMPSTGPEAAALAGEEWSAQRLATDPVYNERLGKAYFAKQLQDFGDPTKAAAAYNAGPGAVQQAIAKFSASWLDHLPKETQDYVRAVTGGGAPATPVRVRSKQEALKLKLGTFYVTPGGEVYQR